MSEATSHADQGPIMARRMLHIAILMLLALTVAACGSDEKAEKDQSMLRGAADGNGRARFNNLTRKGFTVESADLNQDGEEDQWVIKSSDKLTRIERDMNFDGDVDMWQYPDGSGNFTEEEMDLDLDGRVDVVIFYDGGVITRKEISLDFRGGFSIVKFYDSKGNLLRVERDTNEDGKADAFDYYEKGQRVRTGTDKDGDGAPDVFDDFS